MPKAGLNGQNMVVDQKQSSVAFWDDFQEHPTVTYSLCQISKSKESSGNCMVSNATSWQWVLVQESDFSILAELPTEKELLSERSGAPDSLGRHKKQQNVSEHQPVRRKSLQEL